MSDDEATREVLGAVKAAVPDIRMHTPVQHIVSAARSRRRRRGLTTLAVSGLVVAVGLTLGLSTPGSGRSTPGAQPYGPKLAAWTVRTGPGGAVTLTLRQLANAAALQRAPHLPHPPSAVRFHVVTSYQSRPIRIVPQE